MNPQTSTLNKILLFFVPFAIIGMTPRIMWLAYIISYGYCVIVFIGAGLGQNRDRISKKVFFYCLVVSAFLAFRGLIASDLSDEGLERILFFVFVLLPFCMAVSALINDTSDFRWVLWGFVPLGFILTGQMILMNDRLVFGMGGYHWPGIISAINILIIAQHWVIKSIIFSLAVLACSGIGLLISEAEQGLAMVIVGIVFLALCKLFANDANSSFFKRIALGFIIISVTIPIAWEIYRGWETRESSIGITFRVSQRLMEVYSLDDLMLFFGDRGPLYTQSWEIFKNNPILGIGIGNFKSHSWSGQYTHNLILEILAECGLAGFIVLIVPILWIAISVFLSAARSNDLGSIHLLIAFIGFFTSAMFSGDFIGYRGIWVFGILLFWFAEIVEARNMERKNMLAESPLTSI